MQLIRTAIWVGLAVSAAAALASEPVLDSKKTNDPRPTRLAEFLREKKCPVRHLAADFIAAADRHNLDWRLLPSIAVVESGCGRAQRRNNIFGWASARKRFESVRAGIYIVAERLANSKLYRDKPLDEMLRTYNRHAGYGAKVKRVMLQVDSSEPLKARAGGPPLPAAALPPPPSPGAMAALRPEFDLSGTWPLPEAWANPLLERPFTPR